MVTSAPTPCALSPGGSFLTLTPVRTRSRAPPEPRRLPATWTRSEGAEALHGADRKCWTHRRSSRRPPTRRHSSSRLAACRPRTRSPGCGNRLLAQMSYTVPAGWTNDERPGPRHFCPSSRKESRGAGTGHIHEHLAVVAEPAVRARPRQTRMCTEQRPPWMMRLSERPGLVVTDRQPVTVGGYQGVQARSRPGSRAGRRHVRTIRPHRSSASSPTWGPG